jgi:hypothetical protein
LRYADRVRRSSLIPSILLLIAVAAGAGFNAPVWVVICAPGYPGDTEQAQPMMDALALRLTETSGRPADSLRAVYHQTLEGGLDRLGGSEASIALVGLPFYLEFRELLGLTALLQIEHAGAELEQWSLVARRSALSEPGSLDGWELAGMAGYAPNFVRRVALAEWGELPEHIDIQFSKRVVSKLRSAAAGEPIAVLLDRGQTEALARLDFADELEIVARSDRLPASLVCAVGDGLSAEELAALRRGFLKLPDVDGGAELLESIRIDRFAALDTKTLEALERAYDRD